MKRKNIFAALIVASIAGICVITSCSKEQTKDIAAASESTSKNVLAIANENNPYDYCGRIHNEILDYIISNNPHPTHEDIFNLSQEYLLTQYSVSCDVTFEELNNEFCTATDFIIDAILSEASFKTIIPGDIVAGALDTLINYSKSIISSNTLPSPRKYADYLIEQERLIVNKREAAGISPDATSEYDAALGMFAIARYSYFYWYNVAKNPENAWNHVKKSTKKQDGNDPKPGFWKRLKDGFCDVAVSVAETVAKVIVTPIVDAAGFVVEGIRPNNNPSSFFGFTFDASAGIQGAGDWSGEIWE